LNGLIWLREIQNKNKINENKSKYTKFTGKVKNKKKQKIKIKRRRILSSKARERYYEEAMNIVDMNSRNKISSIYKVYEPSMNMLNKE
jgi:hypothetical protein